MPALYKQLMMTVAVEAFQDVYRVVAALTLFAVVPHNPTPRHLYTLRLAAPVRRRRALP